MKKVIVILSLATCLAFVPAHQKPKGDATLANFIVNATLWYQHSAEMQVVYWQSYARAKHLLLQNMEKASQDKPKAVVLDIDETVLDNSPFEAKLIQTHDQYTSDLWAAWVNTVKAKPLPGALDFLHFARKLGVDIYYISNRSDKLKAPTLENLKKFDFPQATPDHVLLKTDTGDKTARREKVLESHDVVLYVGDNLTDYSQVFADRGADYGQAAIEAHKAELLQHFIMLPNPMYGEWEKAIYDNNYGLSTQQKIEHKMKALTVGY